MQGHPQITPKQQDPNQPQDELLPTDKRTLTDPKNTQPNVK